MVYKVAIAGWDGLYAGRIDYTHTWWKNFINAVDNETNYLSLDVEIDQRLAVYNGRNISNSIFIEFDSEEDFLVFKLKFS